ncbi:major facilitator superfamily domain-containing protein [Lophiotrema nucula]|uniref:Major facilitator superfamily domain-containing protein n=1 Tax=Lophiotrema nucula TaxID=690887 RepID=A0A6A5ZUZ4_9PLEO|nr:major facilitator superfamily domain-containing protein [Lophiotrema nucula]
MASRSFDDKESRKDGRGTLPLSKASTETASMQNISITSSLESHHDNEPNWPRSWRAYACWLGCFFLMFNSWGLVNAYGTFASFYVGNTLRDKDQLELNLIGSTQSFLVLLFSAPVGRLLDAGHFRWVVGTGAFLVPFGMFMLSVAHPNNDLALANYAHIWITQGFVVGLGMACYFVSSSQIAATWFPNRKGLAVGFVACGASVAGVIYPTMTRYLIDAMGFNDAVRLVAAVVTVTSIFSLIFATPNPVHVHPRPQSYRALGTWIDKDALKNTTFIWFSAAVAFLFFGFYPVFFNLEEWAAVSGYGTRNGSRAPVKVVNFDERPIQTFWLLTIMNGASTVGRLTMAAFSDRTGQLNMHIVAQIVSSLLVLILWTFAGSTAAAIAFCVTFGMFSGAVIGLPPASMANILNCTYNTPSQKVIAHGKLGQWTGMMYSLAAVFSLCGPLVAGHLVTVYETYITVQMWAGANLMVSAFCMLGARWYLPCYDGEMISTKLARLLKRGGEKTGTGNESDSDAELSADNTITISQVPTVVPSEMPSRLQSGEKITDVV